MKKLSSFILLVYLICLCALPVLAARRIAAPDVPNLTCDGAANDDLTGVKDADNASCSAASPFTDGKAAVQDAIYVGMTTGTDAFGDFLQKTIGQEWNQGEIALWANFAIGTYYVRITYQGSGLVWVKTGSTNGITPNNAVNGFWLPECLEACEIVVGRASSNGTTDLNPFIKTHANYKQNSVAQQGFALNGNNAIFIKPESNVKIYCSAHNTDPAVAMGCPSGTPEPPAAPDYEVLEVGANVITSCAHAAWDSVSAMPWNGFDETTGLSSSTVKLVWDNAATDVYHVCATIPDTEALIPAVSDDTNLPNTGADDAVRVMLKDDTNDVMDAETSEVMVTPRPIHMDRNYPSAVATMAYDADVQDSASTTAGVSYQVYWRANLGFDATPDQIVKGTVIISDKDTGSTVKLKNASGTSRIIRELPSEWYRLKLSSTTIPAAPSTPVVAITSFTNVETTSMHVNGTTTIDGSCQARYGAVTKTYTLTSSAVQSVSGVFTIALSGLTVNTTYFVVVDCTAAGQTGTSAESSQATDALAATLFANSSVQGDGLCLSAANACLPSSALALAQPGSIVEFAHGAGGTVREYAGSGLMLDPPDGRNGTALLPITVRCETDGKCRINGSGVRQPIKLVNNDFWIIEGFDAHNSNSTVVQLTSGSSNNIVRRVCAWDAPTNQNEGVFGVNSSSNLLEDVCAFGNGRKIFSNSQGGNNLTIRRAWAMFNFHTDDGFGLSGNLQSFSHVYNSYNALYENVIGTWNEDAVMVTEGRYGIIAMDRLDGPNFCANARVYGSIAYVPNGQTLTGFEGALRSSSSVDCLDYKNIVTFLGTSHSTRRPVFLRNVDAGRVGYSPALSHNYANGTEIGGTGSLIGSDWTVTNRATGANVAAVPNIWNGGGSSGARVCFRYVNGVLSSTPLWPWPMNQRIIDAMTADSRTPVDVTAAMNSIFGTIPAECGG